jgi:hypothetical protein
MGETDSIPSPGRDQINVLLGKRQGSSVPSCAQTDQKRFGGVTTGFVLQQLLPKPPAHGAISAACRCILLVIPLGQARVNCSEEKSSMAVSLRLRLAFNAKTEDRQAVIPTRSCKSLTN